MVGGSGLRVTGPGRTLRDALPGLDRETAVCLMDPALNQGLVKEEGVEGVSRAMRGRRGCVNIQRWWELADGRSQSPLETRIRLICRDGGSPPDELQHRFTDLDGQVQVAQSEVGGHFDPPPHLRSGPAQHDPESVHPIRQFSGASSYLPSHCAAWGVVASLTTAHWPGPRRFRLGNRGEASVIQAHPVEFGEEPPLAQVLGPQPCHVPPSVVLRSPVGVRTAGALAPGPCATGSGQVADGRRAAFPSGSAPAPGIAERAGHAQRPLGDRPVRV